MNNKGINNSSTTTSGLPVAPAMEYSLKFAHVHKHEVLLDKRTLFIVGLCMGIGVLASFIAQALTSLIGLVTNIAFYGTISSSFVSPSQHQRGIWVIIIPAIGGLIVGLLARFGSKAIRGHGIPEAMEQVLFNESKIPARLTILKPLSSAIAIGTGGPFGAEGPIIATGGALGSFIGQISQSVTPQERKTLLAAGAAAGMTATFGSPISAILLAIELLLFEFRPKSFIPVSLATLAAFTMRLLLVGSNPAFTLPQLSQPHAVSFIGYFFEGAFLGWIAVLITKLVYWLEDLFEHLPIDWMWWPAIGGVVIGVVGYISPLTLGVGYDNIDKILSGNFETKALAFFCLMKLTSWSISLASGTSGGTLAPLFTIGGGIGAMTGTLLSTISPQLGVDVRIAALVGMASTFAGASRALLASIIFAFETTQQFDVLPPLLAGCTASFIISALIMKHTIMTEKLSRRGRTIPSGYITDPLEQAQVRDYAIKHVITFPGEAKLQSIREQLKNNHSTPHFHSYPVVNPSNELIGIVTLKDIFDLAHSDDLLLKTLLKSPAVLIDQHATLKHATQLMNAEKTGRLIVIASHEPRKVLGMLTRRDLFSAHQG